MTKKWINCDLGEGLEPDPDALIMPLIEQASIACGGHAGDKTSMMTTLALAQQHQVHIGAHPSYHDRQQFGRVSLDVPVAQLYQQVMTQISTLAEYASHYQLTLNYIKPHGALYHDMMQRQEIADMMCRISLALNGLPLVVQAGQKKAAIMALAQRHQIPLYHEAFADRAYRGEKLLPRTSPDALLTCPEAIVEQYHAFQSFNDWPVHTICFHSDHAPSVAALQRIQHQKC